MQLQTHYPDTSTLAPEVIEVMVYTELEEILRMVLDQVKPDDEEEFMKCVKNHKRD